MARYYYSRYAVVETQVYIEPSYYDSSSVNTIWTVNNFVKGYSFSKSTALYSESGGTWSRGDVIPAGTIGYYVASDGRTMRKYRATTNTAAGSISRLDVWYYRSNDATLTTNYSRGAYITEVVAEDGMYPENGVHSDGYWYVRGSKVFPDFKVKADGQLRTSEEGWVKINGVLRPIEQMWVKVNGVIKEV